MHVRLATPDDAEPIRAIYNAEVLGSTVNFDLVPRTLDQQQAWLSQHSGAHPAVVAAYGSTVVGFASLSPYRLRPAYATTAEDSVYVHADHRGQGVGRLLLGHILGLARQGGFHSVMARVVGDHHASIGLHRSAGFRVVGTEMEVGRKFGKWLDVALLQYMVPPGHTAQPEPVRTSREVMVGSPAARRVRHDQVAVSTPRTPAESNVAISDRVLAAASTRGSARHAPVPSPSRSPKSSSGSMPNRHRPIAAPGSADM